MTTDDDARVFGEPLKRTKIALAIGRGEPLDIEWPPDMPFPSIGDRVVVQDMGGHVRTIEYHPHKRRILVILA